MSELEIYKGMVKKMKDDEIKEILNGFKEILDNPTTTDECYDGRIIEINRSYDLDLEEIKTLLDYITNLQQKYDRALEDNVKESHRRMELENTLHKIMISDGETTTPILDLIKENERLKEKSINEILKNDFDMCVKDLKKANKKIEKLEDYKSRCEELQKDRDYWQQQYNIYANLSEDYKSRIEKADWWLREMLKQAKSDETKAIINGTLDLLLNGRSDE